MEQYTLIIDNRENYLREYFTNKPDITLEFKNLDVGDIQFTKDNIPLILIERKSVSDMAASIKDGRAREQKCRLLSLKDSIPHIIYLIEGYTGRRKGCKDGRINNIPISTIQSSIINTQYRDGLSVYKTGSASETAEYIERIYAKLVKGEICTDNTPPIQKNYDEAVMGGLKIKKRDNITPELWYRSALTFIPGVTAKLVENISAVYPTLKSLIDGFEEHGEKALADITYQTSTGKSRRIGDKLSQRVYKYFT